LKGEKEIMSIEDKQDIDWLKIKKHAHGDAVLEFYALRMIIEYHQQLVEVYGLKPIGDSDDEAGTRVIGERF
jgi:hypothetical protein